MMTEGIALGVRKLAGLTLTQKEVDERMHAFHMEVEGPLWRSENGVQVQITNDQVTVYSNPTPLGFENEIPQLLIQLGWTSAGLTGGEAKWIEAFYRHAGPLEVESLIAPSVGASQEYAPPLPSSEQSALEWNDEIPPYGNDLGEARTLSDQSSAPIVIGASAAAPVFEESPSRPPSVGSASLTPTNPVPITAWARAKAVLNVDSSPDLRIAKEAIERYLDSQGVPRVDMDISAALGVIDGRITYFAFIAEVGENVPMA